MRASDASLTDRSCLSRVGGIGFSRVALICLMLANPVICLLAAPPSAVTTTGRFSQETLLLQVWLDRANLSAGSIDGVWGEKTAVALRTWQTGKGLPATGRVDADLRGQLDTNLLFTTYVVTAADHAELVVIPTVWPEKAALARMGYETVQEKVAEQFHLSPKGLARLNSHAAWPNPPAGTELRVPDVADVALESATRLVIHLRTFQLQAFAADGRLVALFPVSIAREQARRPVGEVFIKTIAPNPNYLYDPALFGDPLANGKKIIQPGPNNPVGRVWFGLSLTGYGIHGSPHPETIGRAESKGCFRLSNWNALKLLQMIKPGIPIQIEES